jgi:signal transduction histidine kinase
MSLRSALGGVLAGVLTAALSLLVSGATGEPLISVVPLLAVAVVGLTLGSAAALWAYGVTGAFLLVQAILSPDTLLGRGDAFRLVAFVLGAPIVVILALRLERERDAARIAHELEAAATRQAVQDRADADAARRDLQAALRQVEEERSRLEEVAGAVPEPVIVYDEDGRGTYANRAALQTFGRSFFDRPVEEWGKVAEPRDERGRPLPPDRWPQVRARREPVQMRLIVRLPMASRELTIDVEGTPLPGGGCILLLRDVGQEVDERQRLSRFGSFVAHELRNPLAVAKARIELGAREAGLPLRAVEHGERALESVDAAIAILERLELFSRAEAGRVEAASEPFDVQDAVRAAIERLRARGSDRPVEVEVDGRTTISGDRQLTEQALTNLLVNADRYSHEASPIHVRISAVPTPEVRVADGGPGIPDEVAERLFHDRVSSGRGLGLGLYLVRTCMEAQGGAAMLETRRPGAVFVLRWPGEAVAEPSPDDSGEADEGEPAAAAAE